MKTIKKMKEDIAILLNDLGNMRSLCASENRDPTKDEVVDANAKLSEIDNLEKLIDLEKRTQSTP